MKKKTLIMVIIIALAAVGTTAYFFFKGPGGPNETELRFENKVVKISGQTEAVGLVQEYREGKHIILKPVEGKSQEPVFYPIDKMFSMTILASSIEEYLEQKREKELQQIKEQEKKLLALQMEAALDQTDEQKKTELAGLAEAEKKKIREEEAQAMLGNGLRFLVGGRDKEAFDSFYKVTELAPRNAQGFFYVGFIHLSWNDAYAAIGAFSSAIFNEEDLYEAYLLRGLALATINERETALEDLVKASKAVSLFAQIPKRYLEEGVVQVPGGEIRTSSKRSFQKPTGKMVIAGKETEYNPVEGGGFLSAQTNDTADVRQQMYRFLSQANPQDLWEIIRIVIKNYKQQLYEEIQYQIKKGDKEKPKEAKSK